MALVFAATRFDMTTDTAALISPKVKWRQDEARLAKAFPQQNDLTVVVIDGKTPELAEDAAARLYDRLATDKRRYLAVRRPDGGDFFAREGLLLQSTAEVKATTEQLVKAQPFLGPLAADPSLRGVMTALQTFTLGVQQKQTTLAEVDRPIAALADAMQDAAHGQAGVLLLAGAGGGHRAGSRRRRGASSWSSPSSTTPTSSPAPRRGKRSTPRPRRWQIDAAHGATARLTGSVPLSDEEFASLADNAWLVTGAMLASVAPDAVAGGAIGADDGAPSS